MKAKVELMMMMLLLNSQGLLIDCVVIRGTKMGTSLLSVLWLLYRDLFPGYWSGSTVLSFLLEKELKALTLGLTFIC
jgi:hypothetical protein